MRHRTPSRFLQSEVGRMWRLTHPRIAGASPAVPTGAAGQPAIQTLTQAATGGTNRIQLDGTYTPAFPFNATVAQLQTAVNTALGLYEGSGPEGATAASEVVVGGSNGGPWTLTFPIQAVGPLSANTAVTVDNTAATGGNLTAAVTQEGIVGGDELQGSGQVVSQVPVIVGSAGAPAYAAGWSTPVGASIALTVPNAATGRADWEPLQFYQDADGFVHIEGVAVWAAAAAGLIFTLPAPGPGLPNYRPFQSHDDTNVEVRPDGTVTYMGSTASLGAINVGDISFRPIGI